MKMKEGERGCQALISLRMNMTSNRDNYQVHLPNPSEDNEYERQSIPICRQENIVCRPSATSMTGSEGRCKSLANEDTVKEARKRDRPSKGEKVGDNCHESLISERVVKLEEFSDLPALWLSDDQSLKTQATNPVRYSKDNRLTHRDCNVIEPNESKTHSEAQKKDTNWLGVPVNAHTKYAATPRLAHEKAVKLPAFTGKESWKVWYNRFNTIAQLNTWDETTKLNQLLPRLEGDAGEFVYGELPQEIKCNFRKLIEELESRFRMVKTHKTYEAQLPRETIEEYAADLKRLYDKAHVKCNPESRREGLLRRFLNGLTDDQAGFEVEYHKDPSNIDEAVSHVVNYMEARKAPNVHELGDGDKIRRKNVTFHNHDSVDSDSDFKIEMHLRLKK